MGGGACLEGRFPANPLGMGSGGEAVSNRAGASVGGREPCTTSLTSICPEAAEGEGGGTDHFACGYRSANPVALLLSFALKN